MGWSCAIGVLSSCLVALSWQDQLHGSWDLVAGLELGRQAAWRSEWCNRVGVVKLVGGIVLAVAVICDCLVLGSGWACSRSSSCLAAGV